MFFATIFRSNPEESKTIGLQPLRLVELQPTESDAMDTFMRLVAKGKIITLAS